MHSWVRAFGLAIALVLIAPAAVAVADPPDTHEYLSNRPSGFWTSNRPAVGGAYRYRLLLIGVAVATGMGLFAWRLVRRANASPRRELATAAPRDGGGERSGGG